MQICYRVVFVGLFLSLFNQLAGNEANINSIISGNLTNINTLSAPASAMFFGDTIPTSDFVVTGTIFEDRDNSTDFNIGDLPGASNVKVYLYSDENGNGIIDGSDTKIDSVFSDANGEYLFEAFQEEVTIMSTISMGSDDAEELISGPNAPAFINSSTNLDFGYQAGGVMSIGLRYQALSIPNGATILDASLVLTANATDASAFEYSINGEKSGDAATFTGLFNSRPKTVATVIWDNEPTWSNGMQYTSPDISTIVQEIVNQGTWASGNDMAFFIIGNQNSFSDAREVRSYETTNAGPVNLSVTYVDVPVDYLVVVDTTTFPSGAISNTDLEIPIAFSQFPEASCDNDFGYIFNLRPLAVNDTLMIDEDEVLMNTVITNDSDPDLNNLSVNTTPFVMPTQGMVMLNMSGSFEYTPTPNYYGIDSFTYVLCDDGIPVLCDTACVFITIDPINDTPVAVDDVTITEFETSVVVNILANDDDPNDPMGNIDPSTVDTTGVMQPTNGTLLLNPDGTLTYTPDAGFEGDDMFEYIICDDGFPAPPACDTALVTITVLPAPCGELLINVLIEGAVIDAPNRTMHTLMNDYHMLPGQDSSLSSNFLTTLLGENAPIGQPYMAMPWNYNGVEGDGFGDPVTNPGSMAYPAGTVDWVLLSVRAGDSLATSKIYECAGLLQSDGAVIIPEDCDCLDLESFGGPYYVVVQHRNHMPVMSEAIYAVNDTLTFDFSSQQSWIFVDVVGNGQKEISPGVFAMYLGNTEQSLYDPEAFFINSADQNKWRVEQGTVGKYFSSDHNMDGFINSQDEDLWRANQGVFTFMPR